MRRLIFLAGLAAGAGLAGGAHAEAKCTPAAATRATVGEIEAAYEQWRGRCVAVSGMLFERKLYPDRDSFLVRWDRTAADRTPKPYLLIYPQSGAYERGPLAVDVVGQVGSCADENAAAEGYAEDHPAELIMTVGYCHTSMDDYVRPVRVERHPEIRFERFTETELGDDRRELVEAPPDLPGRAKQAAAAAKFAQALAQGDLQTFTRLREPGLAEELDKAANAPPEPWLQDRMQEMGAELKDLRGVAAVMKAMPPLGDVSSRTYMSRTSLEAYQAVGEDHEDGPFTLQTCWCKTADCTGRWPAMSVDADNLPSRPYVCIETSGYLLGPGEGTVISAQASHETQGFAEPQ